MEWTIEVVFGIKSAEDGLYRSKELNQMAIKLGALPVGGGTFMIADENGEYPRDEEFIAPSEDVAAKVVKAFKAAGYEETVYWEGSDVDYS